MRLVFTSTSGMGHFNPLVLLIDAAVARDDDVLVVGPPKLEPVLAARDQAYRIGAAPAEAETAQLTVEPTGEPMGRTGVLAPGDSGRIRQSLELILADDSYRQAAQGLAAEMSALPTATARELPRRVAGQPGRVAQGPFGTTILTLLHLRPQRNGPVYKDPAGCF